MTVKTYAFDKVVEEMTRANIPTPKIAVMLHNGIVEPIFKGLGDGYVPCVIPQSYDFVESVRRERREVYHQSEKRRETVGDAEHGRGERVHALLTSIGANSQPDEDFEYTLLRKYFINCVANLLSIVGDCNCDGLLNHEKLASGAWMFCTTKCTPRYKHRTKKDSRKCLKISTTSFSPVCVRTARTSRAQS